MRNDRSFRTVWRASTGREGGPVPATCRAAKCRRFSRVSTRSVNGHLVSTAREKFPCPRRTIETRIFFFSTDGIFNRGNMCGRRRVFRSRRFRLSPTVFWDKTLIGIESKPIGFSEINSLNSYLNATCENFESIWANSGNFDFFFRFSDHN